MECHKVQRLIRHPVYQVLFSMFILYDSALFITCIFRLFKKKSDDEGIF